MYKVGQVVKYLGETLVFVKHATYVVEESNDKFFTVGGYPYFQASSFWESAELQLGDWVFTASGKGIAQFANIHHKGIKVNIEEHPHRDVIRAFERGEEVEFWQFDACWATIKHPSFYLSDKYRVKLTSKFVIGDWVENDNGSFLVEEVLEEHLRFKGSSDYVLAHHYKRLTRENERLHTMRHEREDVISGLRNEIEMMRAESVTDAHLLELAQDTAKRLCDERDALKAQPVQEPVATPCTAANKHWDVMKKWAKGAEVQTRAGSSPWLYVTCPAWHSDQEYRLAPEKVTQLYQLYHEGKPYGIEVTYLDNKIDSLKAI
jgi:hypothetical protein